LRNYGVLLSPLIDVRDGDYDDLAGAGLVVLTAGVNEKESFTAFRTTLMFESSCIVKTSLRSIT
jgi:malate/lactate dehydrogenase